jgi:hypothetical protein
MAVDARTALSHRVGAAVHPAFGRQETRTAELPRARPQAHSLQEGAVHEGEALPERSMKNAYDHEATLKGRKFVPGKY